MRIDKGKKELNNTSRDVTGVVSLVLCAGPIPSWLSRMVALMTLNLGINDLTGECVVLGLLLSNAEHTVGLALAVCRASLNIMTLLCGGPSGSAG